MIRREKIKQIVVFFLYLTYTLIYAQQTFAANEGASANNIFSNIKINDKILSNKSNIEKKRL